MLILQRALMFGVLFVAVTAPAAPASAEKSSNVSVIKSFTYGGGDGLWVGSDMDFSGRHAYVGHLGRGGGVHIYDLTARAPREVGFIECPGYQNDVAVVRPGLLALGYHDSRCTPVRAGIQLFDVSNPRRPRMLGGVAIPGGGTHTLTVYPGKPLIYSSPAGGDDPAERFIDVSNPMKPKIVSEFEPGPDISCHDVTFYFSGPSKMGVCAGIRASQLWDVSNPLEPRILSQIVNPLITYHHSAAISPDGNYLVIGDEGLGACVAGSFPLGAIWVYDITDVEGPLPVSYFGIHRERATVCTAHNFNFIPGTRYLVSSWYLGGMNVIDLSDPTMPTEVAYYQGDNTDYWSAYWYRGRIYASGIPGLDVFEVDLEGS